MRIRFFLAGLPALCVATIASAQASSSPVADALRSSVTRGARNLSGSADAMPADKYNYRPTPAQMSFAQVMLHVATSNEFLCSRISGMKAPDEAKLDTTASKDAISARVKRSFEYCTTALKPLTDANLSEELPYFGGRKATRAALEMDLTADLADHYAAIANYLRLNGILPPSAQGRGGMG
jgi:hypothetical protein